MGKTRAPWSLIAVVIVAITLLWTRLAYSELRGWAPMKVTTWDAFGYYQYLPALFIHEDVLRQDWVEVIDARYAMTGGHLYQLTDLPNGNRATKYLCGAAVMESPFFLVGHCIAKATGAPADGFSPPYQWCIALSPLFYCTLALVLLRRLLLVWFTDVVVGLALVLLVLATNAIQYISVDGAQTHGFLFALYAAQLWCTYRWHRTPRVTWALGIGALIGLATITRPTELIMLFIPLLWRGQGTIKERFTAHRLHVLAAVLACAVMMFPQLLYWKVVTGSWLYEVGSKWDFLSPHFRVLFGWEKGWFIYTPITLFCIIGLFLMRGRPWARSILVFTLLNIWIITAWHDWRYGGSYSARALMQSLAVLALPFAALIQRVYLSRWRWPALALGAYILGVNLFQIRQYNLTVIHFNDMNRAYYQAIYLDVDPTPLDMSLLDVKRMPEDVDALDSLSTWTSVGDPMSFPVNVPEEEHATWALVTARIVIDKNDPYGTLIVRSSISDSAITSIRLNTPIVRPAEVNDYVCYAGPLPDGADSLLVELISKSPDQRITTFRVSYFK